LADLLAFFDALLGSSLGALCFVVVYSRLASSSGSLNEVFLGDLAMFSGLSGVMSSLLYVSTGSFEMFTGSGFSSGFLGTECSLEVFTGSLAVNLCLSGVLLSLLGVFLGLLGVFLGDLAICSGLLGVSACFLGASKGLLDLSYSSSGVSLGLLSFGVSDDSLDGLVGSFDFLDCSSATVAFVVLSSRSSGVSLQALLDLVDSSGGFLCLSVFSVGLLAEGFSSLVLTSFCCASGLLGVFLCLLGVGSSLFLSLGQFSSESLGLLGVSFV